MTSLLFGAKEARKEIERFHRVLNHEDIVPEQCYRMSSSNYRWVTYANHIIGLFLSKNYNVIPIFINRAFKEVQDSDNQPNAQPYKELLIDYLCQMAYFLENFTEAEGLDLIPSEIRSAGPKKAPDL
jgi:hypothetical protein